MANSRLLFGAVFVLLWMLVMLLFYHQYVHQYISFAASTGSLREWEPSFTSHSSNTIAVQCNQRTHSLPTRVPGFPNQSNYQQPISQDPCFGRETVLNHSRCPLSQSFKIFVYNVHFPSLFLLQNPTLVGNIKAFLVNHASWASRSDEACVFLAVVGPLKSNLGTQELQERIHNLPYWGRNGANHVLMDLDNYSALHKINTSGAIIASNGALIKQCAGVLNLNIPPSLQMHNSVPSMFESPRRYLLYFETAAKQTHSALTAYKNSTLLSALRFKMVIGCESDDDTSEHEKKLGFCQPFDKLFHQCAYSTFCLVLGAGYLNGDDFTAYTYLLESLRFGAVPVVVGVDKLPFDNVLEWHRAAVILPTLPPPSILSSILTTLQPQVIMEYRRQGQFLINTYFLDQEHIIYTSIALVRALYSHPPPPSMDFQARTMKVTNSKSGILPSPRFLNNFSAIHSLNMWNTPPGPFYMYPVTPYAPPYIQDMFRIPTSNKVQTGSAGHIQGEEFHAKLRGNYPPEGFTVLALTYHRTKHLYNFLSNFEGCPFLSKIVLVWNNDDDPPDDMTWPDIGVAVEVVMVGRNSLNNRFLPFSNIETEAVLAVDDDQFVPFNQLEFAFRVWRENRDRIVGWYDRTAVWGIDDPQWHYVWNPSCQTSMTLTGAAMFHKYYLYLYSYWMPQAARDLVDSHMNGEDIAMNFLIAYISRKPPIKIDLKSDLHSCKECESSISLIEGHLNNRKECINTLVKIWGHSALLRTQFRAEPLLDDGKCM